MKIKVAIIDQDENYAKRLIGNFQIHYADKIEPYYFSNLATYADFIHNDSVQVVLVSDEIPFDAARIPENVAFAWLSSDNAVESFGDRPVIGKYQKSELLYKSIQGLYADFEEDNKKRRGTKGKCFVFTSAQGGVGVTTIAAAYALYRGRLGGRPFFLSMDPLMQPSLYFKGDGTKSFSDAIYALEAQRGNLPLKMESIARKDPEGVLFFSECDEASDIFEMKTDDWEKLLEALNTMDEADSLVIDLPMNFDDKTMMVLQKYADTVIWVCDGSKVGNIKLQLALETLKMMSGEDGVKTNMKVLYCRGLMTEQRNDCCTSVRTVGEIKYVAGAPNAVARSLAGQLVMAEIG